MTVKLDNLKGLFGNSCEDHVWQRQEKTSLKERSLPLCQLYSLYRQRKIDVQRETRAKERVKGKEKA